MVGLLVGWMDGRIAGLKNKHKENRFFYRNFFLGGGGEKGEALSKMPVSHCKF